MDCSVSVYLADEQSSDGFIIESRAAELLVLVLRRSIAVSRINHRHFCHQTQLSLEMKSTERGVCEADAE